MFITTEVTEKDYRALQWSVLINRSKLHLGVAAFLPPAALFFGLSMVAGGSVVLALRVLAFITGGVGLLLLAIIAGAYFSRNKPLGDKRVPLGPHTYEVSEKSISVTSDHRRMEFPVSALQYVTVTREHFFVVPRQGTDLIIPLRGLDAEQIQAVREFGEVVAFSSLHHDSFPDKKTSPEKLAQTFNLFRWATLVFAAALCFTFGNGLIHTKALWWAFVGGMIILSGMLLYLRTGKAYWIAGLYLLPIILRDVSSISLARSPEGHFFQWLLLMWLFASLPVFLFPQFFRWAARIQKNEDRRAAPA